MYGLIVTVHVLAACLFIGTVFFEVCIMAVVRKRLLDYDFAPLENSLIYTSDAADDSPCVGLGSRRHIKKKTQE